MGDLKIMIPGAQSSNRISGGANHSPSKVLKPHRHIVGKCLFKTRKGYSDVRTV